MAAEQAAAVGAERSAGTTSDAARLEQRRAEPIWSTTRRSAHHHLRAADAYDGMLQEGAKVGFDLLEDATGPRRAMAVDVHCNGTWAA